MYNVTIMEVTSHKVCEDMFALLGLFKQAMHRFAEEKNMTNMQIAALYMISRHGGELPMGKVACVLHCDPSNVTGIVDRLVTHKFVTRTESPQDRRAKNITLTSDGRAIVTEFIQTLPERLGCNRLENAERVALHSAIQKIIV